MNTLFQYLCPACASHLATNDERKIMVCGSCGNVYDYDYFREDKILDMADLSRKNGEYESAAEMYSFMLDKEPANFRALNGLMLCENKLNDIKDIPSLLKKDAFSTKVNDFAKFKDNCSPEHKAYFDKAEEAVALGRKYVILGQKSDVLKKGTRRLQSKIDNNNEKARQHYIRNKNGGYSNPIYSLIGSIFGLVVMVVFIILTLIESEPEAIASIIGYSIIFPLVLVVIIVYFAHEVRAHNEALKPNDSINDEINQVIEEKKGIDELQEKTFAEIKRLVMEAARLIPKDN